MFSCCTLARTNGISIRLFLIRTGLTLEVESECSCWVAYLILKLELRTMFFSGVLRSSLTFHPDLNFLFSSSSSLSNISSSSLSLAHYSFLSFNLKSSKRIPQLILDFLSWLLSTMSFSKTFQNDSSTHLFSSRLKDFEWALYLDFLSLTPLCMYELECCNALIISSQSVLLFEFLLSLISFVIETLKGRLNTKEGL